MKKLIILLTLVAVSFSADKWAYLVAEYQNKSLRMKRVAGYLMIQNFHVKQVISDSIDDTKYDGYRTYDTLKDGGSGYVLLNGLKLLGEDGWELVNVIQQEYERDMEDYDISQEYYFKRKIGE